MLGRRAEDKILKAASLYHCVLINGPRQVGKTSLARKLFPNHRWVLLDSAAVLANAKEDPALFLKNSPPPVIFDEVQKAPELFAEIKEYIDRHPQQPLGSIVLTGSQPLQLMNLVSDSLAGRIGIIHLTPMDVSETHERSSVARSITDLIDSPPIGEEYALKASPLEILLRGGFPAMALPEMTPDLEGVAQRFTDYIATYLTRDLRDLAQIQNLGRFEKWLRCLATVSGKIPNLSELAAQIGLNQSTAHEWQGILHASMILDLIPAYTAQVLKREVKRPKVVLCDSGLLCNLLGFTSVRQLEASPFLGSVFETSVINSIKALTVNKGATIPIYHWRVEQRQEVDCVVELDAATVVPIEAKFSSTVSRDDLKGMYKFLDLHRNAKIGVIVTPNERCYWVEEGKVLHLPWGLL
jgi:predicted AAA+ superfamily ATPase